MTQYIDHIATTTTEAILAAAVSASGSNDSLTVRCVSEEAHDRLIGELVVAADEIDYCEQADQPTDMWGSHDDSEIRIYIEHA